MFARRNSIFVTVGFSLGPCLLLLPVVVVVSPCLCFCTFVSRVVLENSFNRVYLFGIYSLSLKLNSNLNWAWKLSHYVSQNVFVLKQYAFL